MPVDDVVGRVVLVVWPLSRIATVPVPEVFAEPGVAPTATP